MRVEAAAVFFFDILGFGDLVDANRDGAVDALSDLAAVLGLPDIVGQTSRWDHRYALSDSVFLTHRDPAAAAVAAADLMFNLIGFTLGHDRPTLIRGGLAFGEIEHVRGIFDLQSEQPGNLIGRAAAQAVSLERAGRGPRIFVSSGFVAAVSHREPVLAAWLFEQVADEDFDELLWLLPPRGPEAFEDVGIAEVCGRALVWLEAHGAHTKYGEHYRECALLAARCVRRLRNAEREGRLRSRLPLDSFMSPEAVEAACRGAGPLPPQFVERLRRLVHDF